jgi:hypothetical protein
MVLFPFSDALAELQTQKGEALTKDTRRKAGVNDIASG